MSHVPEEELIRRYANGDRDPELLRQLNAAAWGTFHDPWEAERPEEEDPMEEEATYDRSKVRPLSVEMLERFLVSNGWHPWKRDDGMLMVTFRYDSGSDRETTLRLMRQGREGIVLELHWISDRRVSAEQFDIAFRLCNEWNSTKRWPRAFLMLGQSDPVEEENAEVGDWIPTSGSLTLDFQLLLGKGIHQELLDDLLRDAISGGWEFWELAHEKYGL